MTTTRARRRRAWLRWLRNGLLGAVVAFLAVYGWARLSVNNSMVARALIWGDADVGDQFRFPSRPIPAGDVASDLPSGPEIPLPALSIGGDTLGEDFLRRMDTRAFVIAQDDRVVYERYFGDSGRDTLHTSFSVAKSFLSTLVGLAIEEGSIGSIDDPVTEYVPELLDRDPRFERITIRHLLTMSSGLRYWETDLPWPWADDTYTYYGANMREIALEKTKVEGPPGQEMLYNNYNPLLLSLVLERSTGMTVSEFMSTRLWQPLGAERDATWNLDSEDSGFEKLESGINATAADYARFGLMFLHGGEWNGTRIVSEEWVREATAADATSDPSETYQYFWWVDAEPTGRFYALGNFGQYIYVAPDANAVIVRSGNDWVVENAVWLGLFRALADELALGD